LKNIKPYQFYLGISLLWLLSILLVNPMGDFPLNDDWAYALSVKHWQDTGIFKLFDWGEMSLVAHVLWGYSFTSVFGFSFTVLRISTLIFSLLGLFGIFELVKHLKGSSQLALIAALLTLFNPIYFSLSFSYMTDVPFMVLMLWSFLFFLKFDQTQKRNFFVLAILLCIWALLIRQLALVLPVAWFFARLLSRKKGWGLTLFPITALLFSYFAYTYGMKYFDLLQGRYNDKLGLIIRTISEPDFKLIRNVPGYFFVVIAYLGFLLAPIHFFKFKKTTKWLSFASFYTIAITGLLIFWDKTIPCLDNVWIDFGVGPTTLFDFYGNFTSSPDPKAPALFWILITAVGVFCSFVWFDKLKLLFLDWKSKKLNFQNAFALASIVIYVSPFLLVGIYDRYLICLIPFVLVLLLDKLNSKTMFSRFSFVFIGLLAVFSIFATHDYLSWNRVRWTVLNDLKETGVPLYQIQGGAEFSTWNMFDENDLEWYKKISGEYKLTFSPQENHSVISQHTYSRWMPGENVLYLSKMN
jgi:hypothetical protein